MAVELVKYPNEDDVDIDQWRTMIQDLEAFTKGLLLIKVENINTAGVPRILENSLLDINGSRYKCTTEVDIGGSIDLDVQSYIYAVANGNTASFIYSTEVPQWEPAKGGWYAEFDGKYNRAIVKVFCITNNVSNFYNNKVILDSFNAMSAINTKQNYNEFAGSGIGQTVYSSIQSHSNQHFSESFYLEPGIYRYQLRGGNAGNAGQPGDAIESDTGVAGSAGGSGQYVEGVLSYHGGHISITVGADGGDGGKGGNGVKEYFGQGSSNRTPGNGGGGGSGMDTVMAGIVARGGISGQGGVNNSAGVTTLPGEIGGFGRGGKGSDNSYTGSSSAYISKGSPGGTLKSTTSGYVYIYRVG